MILKNSTMTQNQNVYICQKCKENILNIRDLKNAGRTVCFVNNKASILATANLRDNEIEDHLSKIANEQHQQDKLINGSFNEISDDM